MELPDGRPLVVDDGVLTESASGDGRLVLWLPGTWSDGFRVWDRVGPAAGATVTASAGMCSVAAVLTPAQQRSGFTWPGFLRRLTGSKSEPSWKLPGGGTCERSGARRTDLVLAWPADGSDILDEEQVRSRWPNAQGVRRIGPNLLLISGVEPPRTGSEPAPETLAKEASELPPLIPTRQLASHALTEARQAEDRPREITALIDLAVSYLHKLDAEPAVSLLKEAVTEARQLGDRAREYDATINLAQGVLMLGRAEQAIELLGPALAFARETGDRYTEKVALERLGLAHQAQAERTQALERFEEARALAQSLGDIQHEATLLWYEGITYAELEQPARALERGEAAVAQLRRLRRPQAEEYAQHLADYRASLTQTAPPPTAVVGGDLFTATTTTTITPQPLTSTADGPSLLRMALTATKAAATFAGSGFKAVPLSVYRSRMSTCSHCDMFTGVRCRVCGCISAAKARLPHEQCPAGRWTD